MKLLKFGYNIAKNLHDEIPYMFFNGRACKPLKVVWELTYKCNLRCSFCYLVHEGRDKILKELTTDEIKNVIDQFSPLFPIITYTGGEPFVRKDIMEILRYTKRKNMCGILTNGTLLNDDICRQLVEMNLDSVTISLDGPEKIHDRLRSMKGSYSKIINSFTNLQKWKRKLGRNKPYLHTNTVIVPQNVKYLYKVVEIAHEIGLDSCSFQTVDPSLDRSGLNIMDDHNFLRYKKPTIFEVDKIEPNILRESIEKIKKTAMKLDVNIRFVPESFTENDLIDYYSQKIDYSRCDCRLPWNLMYISPSGEVYPCFNYKIGNVRKDNVNKLWNNYYYRKFRQELKKRKIFPSCVGCCNMIYRRKK